MKGRPAGWTETVRRCWKDTTGFLLASTEPCLGIRDDELAAVGDNRVLERVGFDGLKDWTPPASWLLGVVLCPGDDLAPLVAWLSRRKRDVGRVHLFLHPSTHLGVLAPWVEAGFPVDDVDTDVDSWQKLHRYFGLALNDRVYADAGP